MDYNENEFKAKANIKTRRIWLVFALLLSANYGSDVSQGGYPSTNYIIFLILCWVPFFAGDLLLRIRGKEVEGEQLSEEMEEMIEKRSTVVKTGEEQACSITKKTMSTLPKGIVLSSILCNGDCQGAVILADNSGQKETLGLLKALSATAANFLGKNMEQ